MGKTMPHLGQHAFHGRSEIKRRCADWIEAAAFGRSTFSG
jgi:hypothetical protein